MKKVTEIEKEVKKIRADIDHYDTDILFIERKGNASKMIDALSGAVLFMLPFFVSVSTSTDGEYASILAKGICIGAFGLLALICLVISIYYAVQHGFDRKEIIAIEAEKEKCKTKLFLLESFIKASKEFVK